MTEQLWAHAAQVSHALHASVIARPQADCLLLIDTVPRAVAEDDVLWEGYSRSGNERVQLAHPGIDPSHYPMLLPLHIAKFKDSHLLEQSAQRAIEELPSQVLRAGSGRQISGWLTSSQPVRNVARHLASSMLHRVPHLGGLAWLRLQDPAVLWWLWSFLSPIQRAALLGPIETFWLLDPAGRLVELRAERVEAKGVQERLTLSAEQWQDVDSIASLNIAIREWGHAQAVGAQFDSFSAAALAAIRRARNAGFNDRYDLAAYARYALEIHPDFDSHPLVQGRLALRGEGAYFTSLIDDLEEHDWQRIANESGVVLVD